MKEIKFSKKFLIFLAIISSSNLYSQVFRFYDGEGRPSSETATIIINKDKKAPIFLFSINDSIGPHFYSEKFFFNNPGDYSYAFSVLPGKYRLELGSKNTDRQYVTFDAQSDKTYLIKDENKNFNIYEKKKSIVKSVIEPIKIYPKDSILKTQPTPAFLKEGHKIKIDKDKSYLKIHILKIDGMVGYNKKGSELWEGAEQEILLVREAEKIADYNLPISPGTHTIEYVAQASQFNGSHFIIHNSKQPQKITFNFEIGKHIN